MAKPQDEHLAANESFAEISTLIDEPIVVSLLRQLPSPNYLHPVETIHNVHGTITDMVG